MNRFMVLVSLLGTACATDAAVPDAAPLTDEALAQRRIGALSIHTWRCPERDCGGEVKGTAPPIVEQVEGTTNLRIAIGGEEPLRCEIMHEEFDVSVLLYGVINTLASKATQRRVEALEAGLFGRHPYIHVRLGYEQAQGAGQVRGSVKLYGVDLPDKLLFCLHDEPGFDAGMRTIVSGIATTFQGLKAPEQSYRAVGLLRLGESVVGYREHSVSAGDDPGTFLVDSAEYTLIPNEEGGLVQVSAGRAELADARGELQAGRFVAVQDGEPTEQWSLERNGPALYTITSLDDGEAYRLLAAHRVFPASGHDAMLRAIDRSGPWHLTVPAWLPDQNPLGWVAMSYRGEGERVEAALDGTPFAQLIVDGVGLIHKERAAIAEGLELAYVRVFQHGEDTGLPGAQPGPVVLEGGLTKALLSAAVGSHVPALRQCAQSSPGRSRVVVRFTVDGGTGIVSESVVEETTNEAVAACVLEVVKGTRFPHFPGDPVIVKYPFVLSPAGAPGPPGDE